MSVRASLIILGWAAFSLACGGGDSGEADAPVTDATPIGGRYEVRGVTIALESGHRRDIAGTVILAEDGGSYTAAFQLQTTYPGAEEALPAEVIGTGVGSIEGRTLRGTAQTQLSMATVPGARAGWTGAVPAAPPRFGILPIGSATVSPADALGSPGPRGAKKSLASTAPPEAATMRRRISGRGMRLPAA